MEKESLPDDLSLVKIDKKREIAFGAIEQFNKLEQALSKLPLPERYTSLGVRTLGDENVAIVELWQSREAIKGDDPNERIARVTVDLVEGDFRIYVDHGGQIGDHIMVSTADFENQDRDDVDVLIDFYEKIKRGEKPTEDVQIGEMRDLRIQALINYAMDLEKAGFTFSYNPQNSTERQMAIAVRENQLAQIERLSDNASSRDALMMNAEADLVEQENKIKDQLDTLYKLEDGTQETNREARLQKEVDGVSNPPRQSRRPFGTE